MYGAVKYGKFRRGPVSAVSGAKRNQLGEIVNLSQITAKYIGQPFLKYSCWGLMCSLGADLGVLLPRQYRHINIDNFEEITTPEELQELILEGVLTIGQPVAGPYYKAGDLLVLDQGRGGFLAMALGGGLAMTSWKNGGVSVIKLDAHFRVLAARRVKCRMQ